MDNKIETLYSSHGRLTPLDTLEAAKQDNYKCLVIAGYDKTGELHLRCSNTPRKDVLWLAKQLELWATE